VTVQVKSRSAWREILLVREAVHVKNVGKHIFTVAMKLRNALPVTQDHTRLAAILPTLGLNALPVLLGTVALVPGRKLSVLQGLQVPAGVLSATHAGAKKCSVKRAPSLAAFVRQDHSPAVAKNKSAQNALYAPREVSATDLRFLFFARQASPRNLGSTHVIYAGTTTSIRAHLALLSVRPAMLVRTQQEGR